MCLGKHLEGIRSDLLSQELFLQPSKDRIYGDVAVGLVDRYCERERHRAYLYAVLGVAW